MPRVGQVAALALTAVISSATAAGAFCLGTWKIDFATVAPWWDDPVDKPDASEMNR